MLLILGFVQIGWTKEAEWRVRWYQKKMKPEKYFEMIELKALEDGMKKVVVGVKDKKELMEVKEKIKQVKLPYYVVRDSGRTQISPGTVTVIGIGPAKEEKINKITGDLKLL